MKNIILSLTCLLVATVAPAQLARTAVSVNGSDANPCSVAAPCRTFGAAAAVTATGGELIAINSGGYGPFTVSQPMAVLAAPGIYAGITASNATVSTGVFVSLSAPGAVLLRGLSIKALSGSGSGVSYSGVAGSVLHVENCDIEGFQANTISPASGVALFADATVTTTAIRNCWVGILVKNSTNPVRALVDSCRIYKAIGNGVLGDTNARVVVRNSVASGSVNHGFSATAGSVQFNAENSLADGNGIMGFGCTGGVMRISNVRSTGNASDLYDIGGVIESWGNNRIGDGGDYSFAVTPIALQ